MSATVNFTIPGPDAEAFKERIRKEAARKGWSISEFCVEALAEYFRTNRE